MSTTLMFLCAGATRMSRIGGFSDAKEPLDEGGRKAAERLEIEARFRVMALAGPARAAVETARLLGLDAASNEALADFCFGAWSGLSFEEAHRDNPEALAAWIADPTRAAPGGETLEAVKDRVGKWMDGTVTHAGPLCAITHPMVIRAALSHALGLPFRTTLAIDLAPLSRVILSHNGHWRLQFLGLID